MTAHAPIPTPYPQRLENFRRRGLPFVVWGLAVAACVVLLYGRAQRFDCLGIAQAQEYEISAEAAGTVESLTVSLYEEVTEGTIVARLDDSQLRASLAVARATVDQLTAEFEAARTLSGGGDAGLVADLRRFQDDEEQRHLLMLQIRVEIETDSVERDRLNLEVERNRALLEAGFVSASLYDNLRLNRDTVQERIDRNRTLFDQTETEYRTAEARRKDFERRLPVGSDPALAHRPLAQAVEVARRQMDEIEVRRRVLVLRSPVTGQVSQVLTARGQGVLAGEPILTVSERLPSEIVAWLDEQAAAEPRPTGRVMVASRRDPDRAAESLVLRISPNVQTKPQRLWRDPRVPDFGRPVVIAGIPALDLIPGELVTIRLLD